MTITKPHTTRAIAHNTGDLPQGKLVHSNTLRKTAWSGRSAERGNPDGHRGFLRGPLLSTAGPIFLHGCAADAEPPLHGTASQRARRLGFRRRVRTFQGDVAR